MNQETQEYINLNPDLQRPLYRGTGGMPKTRRNKKQEREEFEEKFPNYVELEKQFKLYKEKQNR